MVVNNFENDLCNKKTEVFVFSVPIKYLEHPKDRSSINHAGLVRCRVQDVKGDHVAEEVEDLYVSAVEKSLKNKHEKLLVEAVHGHLSIIALIVEQIDTQILLMFPRFHWLVLNHLEKSF